MNFQCENEVTSKSELTDREDEYKIALLHCKSPRAYISLSVHLAHV